MSSMRWIIQKFICFLSYSNFFQNFHIVNMESWSYLWSSYTKFIIEKEVHILDCKAIISCSSFEYEVYTFGYDQGIFLRKIYEIQFNSYSILRNLIEDVKSIVIPWDIMSQYFLYIPWSFDMELIYNFMNPWSCLSRFQMRRFLCETGHLT